MIITRTPYRVSFFGGGTDFPAYYRKHGGAVLSCTINRYSYIQCRILPPFFDHNYRIRYFQTERVSTVEEIKHPSVRECIKFLGFTAPLEMLQSGDIPAMSGIGSSSSFTVGFLQALYGLMGLMCTKRELAEMAVTVEQERIKENVGSQDQYAAAFGGINRMDFFQDGRVQVTPLLLGEDKLNYLQNNLLFCFSGISRISSEIQEEQSRRIEDNTSDLKVMQEVVEEAYACLGNGEKGIDDFGRLLDTAWKIKRRLSCKITNSTLDNLYNTALKAGALGGKLCGAGGGGFFVFYVPPERREAVAAALAPALIVPIRLEHLGAHVIFYTHEDAGLFNPLREGR